MGALLVVAVALRARFTILQNALLPASLIGGAIGFVLIAAELSFGFRSEDYVVPAFHFFTLSFMSLLLTGSEGGAAASAARGGWWLTIGWLTIFVTQALIGLGVMSVYVGAGGGQLSEFLGLLAPLGFAQGPGQAVATGAQWESEFGIDLAVNFGLIYASVGFFASFLVGVRAPREWDRAGRAAEAPAVGRPSPVRSPEEGPYALQSTSARAHVSRRSSTRTGVDPRTVVGTSRRRDELCRRGSVGTRGCVLAICGGR
jgi:ESS family glutamate:Na+ symporter